MADQLQRSGDWTAPGAGHGSGHDSAHGSGHPAEALHDDVPEWLLPLRDAARRAQPEDITRFLPPEDGGRAGAVLILVGQDARGQRDILLIERAAGLRSHAGQVAFPGGAVDPEDTGPVGAALREAREETGLDPAGVRPFARLPELYLPPSNFVVTPVLGWWHRRSVTGVVDEGEVAHVAEVLVDELVDPANRFRVRHPSGYVGPGFRASGLFVWGFTAGLLASLIRMAGWEKPWDESVVVDHPG